MCFWLLLLFVCIDRAYLAYNITMSCYEPNGIPWYGRPIKYDWHFDRFVFVIQSLFSILYEIEFDTLVFSRMPKPEPFNIRNSNFKSINLRITSNIAICIQQFVDYLQIRNKSNVLRIQCLFSHYLNYFRLKYNCLCNMHTSF